MKSSRKYEPNRFCSGNCRSSTKRSVSKLKRETTKPEESKQKEVAFYITAKANYETPETLKMLTQGLSRMLRDCEFGLLSKDGAGWIEVKKVRRWPPKAGVK